jgi:hypothetical protein
VKFDEELLKLFSALGKARAAYPALRRGALETVVADEARRVYVFARVLDDERVVAAFNVTEKEVSLEVALAGDQAKDLLTGRKLRPRDGKLALVLPPYSAALVTAEPAKAAAAGGP